MKTSEQYDVIVIGAGISGLGAALKLKEAGMDVLVLEKNNYVGGRMSTDHIGEYAIDRGATIFGGRFHHMKALVKKLGLEHLAEEFNFTFGLQNKTKLTKIRRARLDDVLFSDKISFGNKMAMMRFGMDVLYNRNKLEHGNSSNALHLDDVCVEEHMKNIGGSDLLNEILVPGLTGPLGGNLKSSSRLILYQTFWNILLMKTWAIKGGMDNIIKAMASKLNVRTNCSVTDITWNESVSSSPTIQLRTGSVENESVSSSSVENNRFSKAHNHSCPVLLSTGTILASRFVVIALPGNIAAKMCTQLPEHVLQLLRETRYGEMVSAHVMLNKSTNVTCAGYGIAKELDCGYEIELEHNRVKELCPEGKGLVSIYMWNEQGNIVTGKSDEEIKSRAEEIVRSRFPECADAIIDTHIIRWTEGIAHFVPGRLKQMAALRQEMKSWKLPVQFAGDYLDGIASESALVTGEEAAENIIRRE